MSDLVSLQVPAFVSLECVSHVQFSEKLRIVYDSAAPSCIPVEVIGFNICYMNTVYVVLYYVLTVCVILHRVPVCVFSGKK